MAESEGPRHSPRRGEIVISSPTLFLPRLLARLALKLFFLIWTPTAVTLQLLLAPPACGGGPSGQQGASKCPALVHHQGPIV